MRPPSSTTRRSASLLLPRLSTVSGGSFQSPVRARRASSPSSMTSWPPGSSVVASSSVTAGSSRTTGTCSGSGSGSVSVDRYFGHPPRPTPSWSGGSSAGSSGSASPAGERPIDVNATRSHDAPVRLPATVAPATVRSERLDARSSPSTASPPRITAAPTTPAPAVSGVGDERARVAAGVTQRVGGCRRAAGVRTRGAGCRDRRRTAAPRRSRCGSWLARAPPRRPCPRRRRRLLRPRGLRAGPQQQDGEARRRSRGGRPAPGRTRQPRPSARPEPIGPARSVQSPSATSTPSTTSPTASASARWPASWAPAASRVRASAVGSVRVERRRLRPRPRPARRGSLGPALGLAGSERAEPLRRVEVAGIPRR